MTHKDEYINLVHRAIIILLCDFKRRFRQRTFYAGSYRCSGRRSCWPAFDLYGRQVSIVK